MSVAVTAELMRDARNGALEEAALIADQLATGLAIESKTGEMTPLGIMFSRSGDAQAATAHTIAAAIRSLKSLPTTED